MRNLHKDIKEKYGIEALQQLQLWEKSVLKDSNYKNHRIFTLKCISYNLVTVSVKLKSSCSKISPEARKIIEKGERQLLQDRVRGINKTIEENGNYINNSKTRLVSLGPPTPYMWSFFKAKEFTMSANQGRISAGLSGPILNPLEVQIILFYQL